MQMHKSNQGKVLTPFKRMMLALFVTLFIPTLSFAEGSPGMIQLAASQTPVRGTVVDEAGNPLPGVGVLVKGTRNGTITEANGSFSLNCDPGDILVFSSVGFINLELSADADLRSVTLREDRELLDEVIVIGYGTTTRRNAVGSVEQVQARMLENRPAPTVTQALQGAAANLIIQRRSYNPNGENNNFNIRGISTLNDNSPLFVIDGLIAEYNVFNNLNPYDIESISILKDAGASAIYGSRSANGVVLVTTRQGKKGDRTRIHFNAMAGYNVPHFLFHPVPGYANATLTNLAQTNSGGLPKFTPDQIRDLGAHQAEEDWFFYQIFEPALQQDYSASVSGGTDKTTYMVSLGYHNQASNYVSSPKFGLERYNMRTNITTELGRLKLTAGMAYTRNNSLSTTGGSLEINASRIPPYYYYKMKSEDGRYLVNDLVNDFTSLGQLESGSFNKFGYNILNTNLTGELKLIEGLKLRGVLGVDITGNTRFTRNFPQTFWAGENATEPRSVSDEYFRSENWNDDTYRVNTQLLLDYNRTFEKHNVYGLIGVTSESFTYVSNETGKKYVDHELGVATSKTNEAGNIWSSTSMDNTSKTLISSLIGRAGYVYDDRYYAEFSFRYDGSSKFHKDYRWGFFPSLSLGWRISQEAFMGNYKTDVGDLKLRASYGILGSQAIGDYDRYTKYNVSGTGYAFNNLPVTTAGFSIGLKDLTWEKTRTMNVGLDASFFKNALRMTFDWFNKNTYDILLNPTTPLVFGTTMPRTNLGEMRNRGWELTLAYDLSAGETRHGFRFNLGDTKNKLVKFPGHEQIWHTEEIWQVAREGLPLWSYFGYKFDGLYQSYQEIEDSAVPAGLTLHPGDIKRRDLNDDGVIDAKDRMVLGHAFPRYTFGFVYNFAWKGFDFSMFWQGVGKRETMIRGELVEPFHENYSYVIYKHQLDFWSPVNTDAKYPRLSAQGSDSDTNNWSKDWGTDIFVFDMKYIRLKNLSVGYTLPQLLTRKVGIEKCRLYVNAQDLLTFCPTSFVDPETSEFGTNFGGGGANSARNYPNIRYFGFGMELDF